MRAFLALVALVLLTVPAGALERERDGFFHTGDAVRVKKVAFIKVKVYAIDHYMKALPATKSKEAVIEAKVDKRLSWKMLRTVESDKLKHALREAYALNGYGDAAKIDTFVQGLGKELKEGESVTISYDAGRGVTTLSTHGASVSVPGDDFMKATWSIWFGKIDQPGLGDSLIGRF
jgi:hypothetical protein